MIRRRFLRATGGILLGLLGGNPPPAIATGGGGDRGSGHCGTVTLFLGGDLMTGRGIDQVLPNPSDPAIHEEHVRDAIDYVSLSERKFGPIRKPVGYEYIWGDALEVLEEMQPDVRIVNLETAVTTHDIPWPGKQIHYRMHPANLPCLLAGGIDACALSNNHVLDWSVEGLLETIDTLKAHGIRIAGAGRNWSEAVKPAFIELAEGRRIVLYSIATSDSGLMPGWIATDSSPGVYGLRRLHTPNAMKLIEEIGRQKRKGDVVVVSIHWGGNWSYAEDREQTRFARNLVDAGVDVIHGHSSHHPKGIEVYRERPIIYGCGDLLNDYEGIDDWDSRYRGELALMYFVKMDAGSGALRELVMQPMRIRNFRLNHATTGEAKWLEATLSREGKLRFNTSTKLLDNGRLELSWPENPASTS
jgi:poly-gamma-glutamate capsule biosynthesis protein CapA/YwtB (metallophosphatase superfamily)